MRQCRLLCTRLWSPLVCVCLYVVAGALIARLAWECWCKGRSEFVADREYQQKVNCGALLVEGHARNKKRSGNAFGWHDTSEHWAIDTTIKSLFEKKKTHRTNPLKWVNEYLLFIRQ